MQHLASNNVNDQILDLHFANISFGGRITSISAFPFKSGGRVLAFTLV